MDPSQVIYASPHGADQAPCTLDRPCSAGRAVELAGARDSRSVIRLLPGIYEEPIAIPAGAMRVLAQGAILRPRSLVLDPLRISGTADVQIEGVEIDAIDNTALVLAGVRCTGTAGSGPRLSIRDSVVHVFVAIEHAAIEISNSTLGYGVEVGDGAQVAMDRVHLKQTRGLDGSFSATSDHHDIRITNSIFERIGFALDTTSPGAETSYYVGFSTFVDPFLPCRISTNPRLIVFENSVFVASQGSPVDYEPGTNCVFVNNVMFPEMSALLTTRNIRVDPRFVDLAHGDYRLRRDSLAIDRATPVTGPGADHDFAGQPRPGGFRSDLGALELLQ